MKNIHKPTLELCYHHSVMLATERGKREMHALRGNTGVEWYPERGFFPVLRMFWLLSMREYQPSTSCVKNITVSQTIAL